MLRILKEIEESTALKEKIYKIKTKRTKNEK